MQPFNNSLLYISVCVVSSRYTVQQTSHKEFVCLLIFVEQTETLHLILPAMSLPLCSSFLEQTKCWSHFAIWVYIKYMIFFLFSLGSIQSDVLRSAVMLNNNNAF